MHLLSTANAKTQKSVKHGWLTGILHLAPSKSSGRNVCPFASGGCIASCLHTAGNGRYDSTQQARIRRTHLWFDNRRAFKTMLRADIYALQRLARQANLKLAIRPNGTSDIQWEQEDPELFDEFPEVLFYDYTKIPGRITPENYRLTFSRSENNEYHCQHYLDQGHNVAAVFQNRPENYWGYPVLDGDQHDLRFLDPRPVVVGLSPKGRAKQDQSGFVIRPT